MKKVVFIKNNIRKEARFDPVIEDKMRILANNLIDRFLGEVKKKGLKEISKSNTLIMEHG